MEQIRTKDEWFNGWFNSTYYHILYKNRDYKEAESFIETLYNFCKFEYSDKIADMGCGKGRHAIYLNSKGCDVTGLDLSPKNISFAQGFSNDRLHFFVHDMRDEFAKNEYDYVLNLFTSFGYFEQEADNITTLRAFKEALKFDGKVVIDFMNTQKIMKFLRPIEAKIVEGIKFNIIKSFEAGFIVKTIQFEDKGKQYEFLEKVKAIYLNDFIKYFQMAGLSIKYIFGDYKLGAYDAEHSDRMIFILENQNK